MPTMKSATCKCGKEFQARAADARAVHDRLATEEAAARAEGRRAWDDGEHSNSNPYDDGVLSDCWMDGFWEEDRAARRRA